MNKAANRFLPGFLVAAAFFGVGQATTASTAFADTANSNFGFGGTAGPRAPSARTPNRPSPNRHSLGGPSLQPAGEPRDFSLALNAAIPDLWSMTLQWRLSPRFAVEFRAAPETKLNIRIEMPADLISTKKNIGVAHPPYTITSKAGSGPGGGIAGVFYPYLSGRDGGGWFIGVGAEQRRFTLAGSTKSPVLICSLIEAEKDPPCGDEDAAIVTRTQIVLDANLSTTGFALRGWTGWRWNFGASGSGAFTGREGTTLLRRTFVEVALGAERITSPKRKSSVAISLDTPGLDDPDTATALGLLKDLNAQKSSAKLDQLLRKYDEKLTPVAWAAAGVWL